MAIHASDASIMHLSAVSILDRATEFLYVQVVFLGLDTVIPLMTGELLQFPKLLRAFFSLIAYMLEVYPERVASLPGGCHALLLLVCSTLSFLDRTCPQRMVLRVPAEPSLSVSMHG